MKRTATEPVWPKVRKFFINVHLWLGLSSGLVILCICFSGTIYVFNTEIREMALPELYRVEPAPGAKKLSAETLIANVSRAVGGKVISIRIFSDPSRSYILTVRKEEEKPRSAGRQGSPAASAPPARGIQYMVDPYTGKILGDSQSVKSSVAAFMTDMFSLHRWLLLDKIEEPLIGNLPNKTLGSYINGTATIIFTLGVMSGLVIWFPRKIRGWKQGLCIKWNANWKRVNHDVHSSLAFYSFIFLLVIGLTGPQWSFPWYRSGLRKTLGTDRPATVSLQQLQANEPAGFMSPMLIADIMEAADKKLAYRGDYLVTLPADSSAVLNISKTRNGFFCTRRRG